MTTEDCLRWLGRLPVHDPSSRWGAITRKAHDKWVTAIRCNEAGDPLAFLESLSNCNDPEVLLGIARYLLEIARCPCTPWVVLERLLTVQDVDDDVLQAVSKHPECPDHIRTVLVLGQPSRAMAYPEFST